MWVPKTRSDTRIEIRRLITFEHILYQPQNKHRQNLRLENPLYSFVAVRLINKSLLGLLLHVIMENYPNSSRSAAKAVDHSDAFLTEANTIF